MSKIEGFKNIEDYKSLNIAINELNHIYQEWLSIFPFELWCFEHLKSEFKKKLPIVENKQVDWEKNEITINLYTRRNFENYLIDLTNHFLASINTLTLLEEGIIDNADKHKLEIIILQRRTKLHSQKRFSRINKPEYLSYIMEWFNDEKLLIEEIKPFLEDNAEKKVPNQVKKISAKWYALLHISKIKAGLEVAFPLNANDQFDYKLIKKYAENNYPIKDGQGFYRAFKELYGEKEEVFKQSFGNDYKEKLIGMTEDSSLIEFLEKQD